jgi:hypothetical protein
MVANCGQILLEKNLDQEIAVARGIRMHCSFTGVDLRDATEIESSITWQAIATLEQGFNFESVKKVTSKSG